MREDGLDLWVTFWAEKRRERQRLRNQRMAGESRGERTQIIYDAAIIVAGVLGILALLRALVAGISG